VLDDLYNTCNNLKSNHPPAPSFVRRGKWLVGEINFCVGHTIFSKEGIKVW
jgi:hypothetical protein